MAKKYKQTRKDREDESRGMERYERKMRNKSRNGYGEYGSFVEGNDPMIGRDSYAGLPSEVVMKEYPRNRMAPGSRLDDSMREIDAIQEDNERDLERHLSHQK